MQYARDKAFQASSLREGREDGGRGYGHGTWARACLRTAEVRPTYYTELFYSGTVGYTLLSGFSGRCHGLRISNAMRLYSNKVEGVSPRRKLEPYRRGSSSPYRCRSFTDGTQSSSTEFCWDSGV